MPATIQLLRVISLLIVLGSNSLAQIDRIPRRLLVVSGGGARGAWGAGMVHYLDSTGKYYGHVIGTSTGSLMAPLVLLRKLDSLRIGYTTASQKDIFNVNPFTRKGGIKIINALFRIGKPSLGTTYKLRKRIMTYMTETDYNQIRNSLNRLDFTVAVVNLRTLEPGFRSASEYPCYKDMVNWIWASANEPVFMSPYTTKDTTTGKTDYWFDGGVRNVIPVFRGIQIAAQKKYEAVDVVINTPPSTDEPDADWGNKINQNQKYKAAKPGLLNVVHRTLDAYGSGVHYANIEMGDMLRKLDSLQAAQTDSVTSNSKAESFLTLNFYFMRKDQYDLALNELIFNRDTMAYLYNEGRNGRFIPQPQSFLQEFLLAGIPSGISFGLAINMMLTSAKTPKKPTYSFKLSNQSVHQFLK